MLQRSSLDFVQFEAQPFTQQRLVTFAGSRTGPQRYRRDKSDALAQLVQSSEWVGNAMLLSLGVGSDASSRLRPLVLKKDPLYFFHSVTVALGKSPDRVP